MEFQDSDCEACFRQYLLGVARMHGDVEAAERLARDIDKAAIIKAGARILVDYTNGETDGGRIAGLDNLLHSYFELYNNVVPVLMLQTSPKKKKEALEAFDARYTIEYGYLATNVIKESERA